MAWSGRADCGPWAGSRRAQGPLAGCAEDRHRARGHPQGMCTSQSRQLCGGHGLGEGRGRIAVRACVEVTTPL